MLLLPEGLTGEAWHLLENNDLLEIEEHWIENIFPWGFNVIFMYLVEITLYLKELS
jgi:hypothetical protein